MRVRVSSASIWTPVSILLLAGASYAGDAAGDSLSLSPIPASALGNDISQGRYGPFNLFDHFSVYGKGFFPEPFLVDEGDLDNELRLTWFHREGHGSVTDVVTAEVEKSFGLLTVELAVPYERDTRRVTRIVEGQVPVTERRHVERSEGVAGIPVSFRHPVHQFVSADGQVDNTVATALEVVVPTNSPVGKQTEVVGSVFDVLRLGDHFGLQTHVGYSTLFGGDPSYLKTLEYSADFSYQLDDTDIPLPKSVAAVVPMFELVGARGLNRGDYTNHLTGILGARFYLDAVGPFSPRIGFGYVFPIDRQARQDFTWGAVTSLVFDY